MSGLSCRCSAGAMQGDYLQRPPRSGTGCSAGRPRRAGARRPALRRQRLGRPTRQRLHRRRCTCSTRARCCSMAESVEGDEKTRRASASRCSSGSTRRRPSNFLALNPEAQQQGARDQGREPRRRAARTCWNDLQQGHLSQTDESVFEVGRNVATTEGAVVFENELFQLHRVQAADGQGVRAAAADRAAVHQQVLHPRPAARELADPLRGRAGPPRLRRQLAQCRRGDRRSAPGTTTSRTARSRAIDVVQEITGAASRSTRWASASAARSSPPRWRCWRRAASSRRRA